MRYDRTHAWGAFVAEGLLAIFAVLASLAFGAWGIWSWFALSAVLTAALLIGTILAGRELARTALDDPSRVPISRLLLDLVPLTVSGAYFVGNLLAAEHGWAIVSGLLLSVSILTLLAGLAANTARSNVRRDDAVKSHQGT